MDEQTQQILERVRSYALPGPVTQGRGLRLSQRGEMRMGPDKPWLPFRAEQHIDAAQLGFRWDARVRMAPLVWVTVTDAFEDGHGRLEIHFLRLRIARATGPEVDEGELMRFLAELPWCPFALSHPALQWGASDDRNLRVALQVGTVAAAIDMQVDEAGRVVRAQTEGRPRQVGKAAVRTGWHGEFSDYSEMGGIRLPARAEVAWDLPEGAFVYWRGEIIEALVV